TELAVYETIRRTQSQLTNNVVHAAFTELAGGLEEGHSPALSPEEPQPELVPGNETPFLVWIIRRTWTEFFEDNGPVDVADLVGVLRTLLYSIKAHQWNSGPDEGYVAFVEDFLQGSSMAKKVDAKVKADQEPKTGGWGRRWF